MNKEIQKPEDIKALIAQIAVATTAQKSNEVVQPQSNIELTNKVVDTLFNSIKRKMLGILTKPQIAGIKKLYIINDIIFENKSSVLTRIINNEIDLSVSEKGVGRDQLVKLTKVEDPMPPQIGRIKQYLQ
jgi:hypothetical protein